MIDLKKYIGYHSPGYVIEIYKDGIETEIIAGNKEVYPKKEKTTKDTLYDIASLTKTFTATLIYIAYEEEKIDINDTVYNIEKKFNNLKQVKIIDLLSHNQNIWTDGYLGNAKSKEEFYNIIYSAYVKENIETYVDVHYMILSTILEKIYKKPFHKICKENDFQKTYNNMGARYRNVIKSLNDIPIKVSDNSVTFSGYTGPMYLVDFDKKIIVIIMCNVIHTAHLERKKRKEITEEIMNMIFNKIL